MTGEPLHVFERAGLGTAPYKLIRVEVLKYQACHGAPIQPGSSCDYCGTGIMETYFLRSTDGREFKVGCDCIRKAGDAGLRKAIAPHLRAQRQAKDAARVAAATAALPTVVEALRSLPHPYPTMAARGMTLLDSVTWNLDHAGMAGRVRAARAIETAAKAVQS